MVETTQAEKIGTVRGPTQARHKQLRREESIHLSRPLLEAVSMRKAGILSACPRNA